MDVPGEQMPSVCFNAALFIVPVSFKLGHFSEDEFICRVWNIDAFTRRSIFGWDWKRPRHVCGRSGQASRRMTSPTLTCLHLSGPRFWSWLSSSWRWSSSCSSSSPAPSRTVFLWPPKPARICWMIQFYESPLVCVLVSFFTRSGWGHMTSLVVCTTGRKSRWESGCSLRTSRSQKSWFPFTGAIT